MSNFDLAMIIVLGSFMIAGWMSGLIKKVISLGSLALSLIVATKYGASIGQTLFVPIGAGVDLSTVAGFLFIVGIIVLAQNILYRVFIKQKIGGLWNRIGGAVFGLIEGALLTSIAVIFISIFLQAPSEKTREDSALYMPIKNLAPRVFDSINTALPESKDFYQEIFDAMTAKTSQGN
jgi:membrane protein required for colicin V production